MAAFVSVTTVSNGGNVTVAAGSGRLLLVAVTSLDDVAGRSVTYGGVSMDVATNSNGFTQQFYMLDADVGTAALSVSGTDISNIVVAQYTGVGSFQGAQESSGDSQTVNPTGAGLVCFSLSDEDQGGHTAITNTNERFDDGADWYGDRIVASGGSVEVGVTTSTVPDSSAAVFLDPTDVDASGSPSIAAVTASGAAVHSSDASGSPSTAAVTASGAAVHSSDASGSPEVAPVTASGTAVHSSDASGSPSIAAVTGSGAADQSLDAAGSPSIAAITGSGAALLDRLASGAPATGAVTGSGVAFRVLVASGAPEVAAVTASGSANLPGVASGVPSVAAVTATGEAQLDRLASGSPSVAAVTATGEAELVAPVPAQLTASDTLRARVTASTTLRARVVTSDGS